MELKIYGSENFFANAVCVKRVCGAVGDMRVVYALFEITAEKERFFGIYVGQPDVSSVRIVDDYTTALACFETVSENEVDANTLDDVVSDMLNETIYCKNSPDFFNIL